MSLLELENAPKVKPDFETARSQNSHKRKKRLAPLSVRMSKEQREQFERDAIGMSLNAYALSCFFDKGSKSKGKQTKRDKAVASALQRLGSLGIGTFITCQILAYEEGRLHLSKVEIDDLRKADVELHRLRCDLVRALGLESEYKK